MTDKEYQIFIPGVAGPARVDNGLLMYNNARLNCTIYTHIPLIPLQKYTFLRQYADSVTFYMS